MNALSGISEKFKALSRNGQGILCFFLLLNAAAFLIKSLEEMRFQMSESFGFTERLLTEQNVFNSPAYKIFSAIVTLIFVFVFYFFCRNSVKKSEEKGTEFFALLYCICPVFLLGFIFIRHSAEFVIVMLAALLAVMLTESKKSLWLVPIVSAFGIFLNAGFAFAFFPAVLLSLCGEREDKKLEASSKKTAKLSAVTCLILFALLIAAALLSDGKYIGALDLTQIADTVLYGASSYDGEIPLVVTDNIALLVICLPAIFLSVFFWIVSLKTAKANGRKTGKLFIFCIAANVIVIPAFLFADNLGMLMLFDVFAQIILLLSLASKREPSVIEALKKFELFFTQKKRTVLIVFVFLSELLICAYIEQKI